MMAYEFYCRNGIGEIHLIGILPERRRKQERITQKSIINFGRMLLGEHSNPEDIFFTQVALDEYSGEIRLMNMSSIPLKYY